MAHGILVPGPGMEPEYSALAGGSKPLDHQRGPHIELLSLLFRPVLEVLASMIRTIKKKKNKLNLESKRAEQEFPSQSSD